MIDFTVAICTYNGESRLPGIFNKLLLQEVELSWEVIVVDNNSSDRTAEIVEQYQYWTKLRYYFEPKQGLAFARRLAIRQARGNFVGFLDDDNLPSFNWVNEAYAFGHLHPQAGAYGSRIQGNYEVEPPAKFEQISCFLAVADRGNEPLRYDSRRWLFPAGAGLVVRKQAWLDSLPESPVLKGVAACSLLSKGEDIEALAYIAKAGWEIWHNPAMLIEHQIPRSRLEKEYLIKLFQGVGLSSYLLRKLRFAGWQRPFIVPLYLINDLRKLIIYLINYQVSNFDLVATCQLELYWHKFISPFYHWSQIYQRAVK